MAVVVAASPPSCWLVHDLFRRLHFSEAGSRAAPVFSLEPGAPLRRMAQHALHHAAGLTPGQMSDWLHGHGAHGLAELPSAGLFRELAHYGHLNTGTAWKGNDLTDMVYLSCAGAYADVVVCERHMASPLAQGVRRLGAGATVFRRLRDAAPAIEEMLSTRPRTDGASQKPGGPTDT
ncbi:hypothetical protein E4P41_20560 [Geodermatophilus sp. DF01-2]|uniref:hypothetical protein n=1 Tax=Geodermatophilus sp. DF01-2 TaxID=2559610 RepID=UPI001073F296|nr:hypothetical protein [Geodermatophilus sp. DF01_2]TFV53905.1 hypothetical protein E4P41_20560 [Geodermatophilus sp. DF01_2]